MHGHPSLSAPWPTVAADGPTGWARFRPRLPVRLVVLTALAAALVLGTLLLLMGGGDRPEPVRGPESHGFTLLKPEGWGELSKAERERFPGRPLAVLRREKNSGVVLVNAQAGQPQGLDDVTRSLDRRLKEGIPDFRKVGAREVRVQAGRALLYSYARKDAGTANTLLFVPAGRGSYTVNAVVPAGGQEAAREVGRILLSFELP